MKNIVLMMRNYYPYYSAVGVCMGNVAESLSKSNKVTIICEKTYLEEADEEIYNNQKIIRIISASTKRRKQLQDKIETSNILYKNFAKIMLLLYRLFDYTKFLISKYSIQKNLVNNYYEALKNLNEPVDIIVPSCMPFETIIAANLFKKKNSQTEVVPFLFDKFAENATLHRTTWNKKLKMNNNLKLERNVFESSKRILFTPSWKEHVNINFSSMIDKFMQVEHPLIKKLEYNDYVNYDPKRINIVYTGTVITSSRNPEPTIKIFTQIISKYPNILLHFYAMGNAVGIIQDFERKYRYNTIFHGQVETKIAHSATSNGTMLLSIGNVDVTQTPSKIFEYMSCCKPIIHISVYKIDPVIEILKDYPLSCCVCLETDSFEDQVRKVEEFIIQDHNKEIKFADLEKIYFNAIPDYSAKIILNGD